MNELFEDYVTALEAVLEAAEGLLDEAAGWRIELRTDELAAVVAECIEARRADVTAHAKRLRTGT